jgi:hypothetical protein
MVKFGEFLITLISSSSVIAAVALFSKNIIAYFLSTTVEIKKAELAQDLESYKQAIQQKNSEFQYGLNERLQEHRGKLELANHEFNIRFSRLHQERADVIKEIYKLLIKLQSAMFTFTRTMHPVFEDGDKEAKQRLDNVNDSIADFTNFYTLNKIFLPKSLCSKIDNVVKEYYDKGWDFAWAQRSFKERAVSIESYGAQVAKANQISDSIKDEMPPLIEELETEFRQILGVN